MRGHPPLSVGDGLGSRAPFASRKGRTPFVLRTFPPRVGETLVMRPSSDSCFRGNDGGWRGGFRVWVGGCLGFPASAGIPRCRFAPAPPSLRERGGPSSPRPPLGSRFRGNDGSVRGNDVEGRK